jgi:SAM-dependent methyltransferase
MSRFGVDPHAFFESVYRDDTPPWDIGGPQPDLSALLVEHPPEGPVLDAGCGSGDLVLAIARRGLPVLGVDVVETAIADARAKAAASPPEVARLAEFQVGDALRPTLLGRRFGAIVDSGFFHVFDQEQRDLYAEEVAGVLNPGGRLYLIEFAIEFDMPNTPLKVTDDELRARFTAEKGWRFLALRPAQFHSRFAPVPAVAACIERAPADAA